MEQIQLKQIGYLAKTHGINGDLVLSLSDNLTFDLIDEILNEGDAVFVEKDGIPVPFFVSENGLREYSGVSLLIRFDDIDNQKALKLVSSKVFIESYKVIHFEKNQAEIASEWIGYEICDPNHSFKGKVKEFIQLKGNPMLNIEIGKKTMLIPLISDFIISVNDKKKLIELNLPDGYIDAML
jgi:16S rRNA processing protein RimM